MLCLSGFELCSRWVPLQVHSYELYLISHSIFFEKLLLKHIPKGDKAR